MYPDEKYMPNKDSSRNNDMKFVPFSTQNSNYKSQPNGNLSNTTITGWIPVYFFNNMNMPINNPFGSFPFQPPSNINLPMPISNSQSTTNLPNANQYNANMPNTNESNLNLYPDETTNSYLHSYNKSTVPNNKTRNIIGFDERLLEALREFDLDLNEDIDLTRNSSNNKIDIDKIFKDIELNNPGTFSLLQAYNVPYPIVKLMVRRVIKLSLTYCNKGGE